MCKLAIGFLYSLTCKGVTLLPEKPKLDDERLELTKILAHALPGLRDALRMSQSDLASVVGLSRGIFSLVETGLRPMTWNVFAPTFLFFEAHEESKRILESMGDFERRAMIALNVPTEQADPAAVCLYCSHRNPVGVRFCNECGTKIGESVRLCGNCGNEAKNGAKFCGNCGTKII